MCCNVVISHGDYVRWIGEAAKEERIAQEYSGLTRPLVESALPEITTSSIKLHKRILNDGEQKCNMHMCLDLPKSFQNARITVTINDLLTVQSTIYSLYRVRKTHRHLRQIICAASRFEKRKKKDINKHKPRSFVRDSEKSWIWGVDTFRNCRLRRLQQAFLLPLQSRPDAKVQLCGACRLKSFWHQKLTKRSHQAMTVMVHGCTWYSKYEWLCTFWLSCDHGQLSWKSHSYLVSTG